MTGRADVAVHRRADVVVVGGGIIGLTAAARLAQAGADVRLWSPAGPEHTVSWVAAAVWYPTRTDYDPRVLRWATATYREFARQAADGTPGVRLRPTRNLGPVAGTPWWAPAAGDVTVGPAEVRFVAPCVEMDVYLPWLAGRVRAAGVPIVRRGLTRLDEALTQAPVVVNATGLAAGRLCGDPAVYPARGQIALVPDPGLTESLRVTDGPGTYVHPRGHDVVLGGTFEPGVWDTTVRAAVRDAIVARCVALVPALAGLPVLGDRVGLRPCRTGGPRVERRGPVVHAYGHGGAGMTLSWGCADEITRLALS
ncbi:FAD-dependent oxidoreductase [Mangrovihabitans endophyticus]|uniref:D-amino-acid oxidase n=1 Tax=Mangrovihabitans endophyticus TaxID=1751298 RepID=A0A8J3C5A3_9ACTN|nr:FAD-dependent oxidoreductase [Mangrovihabitans endophyticus]GGL09350.1 D-amino-acid oxidase [Mangrovihabitans endophyticus]